MLYHGFQKNFGDGKALPSSFKPGENFSGFIRNYNHQLDKYKKELPRVNAQIDAYNKKLAKGVSKIQRLQLPPKLESFKPRSSEARDMVKGSEKRSSGNYWDVLKSVDSTKLLKPCKTVLVSLLLASTSHLASAVHASNNIIYYDINAAYPPTNSTNLPANTAYLRVGAVSSPIKDIFTPTNSTNLSDNVGPHVFDTAYAPDKIIYPTTNTINFPDDVALHTADAVKIQGDGCSIESRLHVEGKDPSAGRLTNALQQVFKEVMPRFTKEFAANPCEESHKKIMLNFTRIDPGKQGKTFLKDDGTIEIRLDPYEEDEKDLELIFLPIFVHELGHFVQNYPLSRYKEYFWVDEGMADYARLKYGSAEKKDWQSQCLKSRDHFRDGYETAAGFFLWLEQHKGEDIVLNLHKRMQEGIFTEKDFFQWTGQTVDNLWEEYRASKAKALQIEDDQDSEDEEIPEMDYQDSEDEKFQIEDKRSSCHKVSKYAALLIMAVSIVELARRCQKRVPADPLSAMERFPR